MIHKCPAAKISLKSPSCSSVIPAEIGIRVLKFLDSRYKHAGRQEDIAIRRQRTKERYKKLGRREGEDHSSPIDMIQAMDAEGLDIGVVFRTYTAHATGTDEIDPKLAAAICRAFNNWLRG